ncbi:hypothetical protein ACGFNY_44165 [Streptomyces chartreusis]|uniref:hypothetical protein n=1 Tax=Streptomyces chartreusis TaxID=1969 RepID=UPI00371FF963
MSAAESARPGPDCGPTAAVIYLTKDRRPRRHRSERTTVPPQPDGPLTPEQRLAAKLERVFAGHQLSLTDDDTRLAYQVTIGEVRTLVDGAHGKGDLSDDAHRLLDAMLEGILRAVDHLP